MKKVLFLLTFLTVSATFTYGQVAVDSISMKRAPLGGFWYYQGERRLTMPELVNIMQPNDLAYYHIRSAQTSQTGGFILSYAGGALIGWPVGTALGGGEPNWLLAGIGAGLVLVAIPIGLHSTRQSRQAVDIFNSGLQTSSFWDENELRFTVTPNGIGFTLRF